MSELEEMSRVLYRHDWPSVDRWADCIGKLAELSDEEIGELERLACPEPRAAA
jgi:hypothetical protein